MKHPFTDSELLAFLEMARLALADADTFDEIGGLCDLSDSEMAKLRDKLQDFMDSVSS